MEPLHLPTEKIDDCWRERENWEGERERKRETGREGEEKEEKHRRREREGKGKVSVFVSCYLILFNDAVGLSGFSPSEGDPLLVGAALDGL